MNKVVDLEELMPLINEKLNSGGEVKFTPKGNSMLPLFESGKDVVTIKAPQFPLKKYDIPLYLRESGKYVLHRVVKVKKDCYVMRGDNHLINEEGIKDEQIIGVVTSFTRKGKNYDVNNKKYKIYCVLWVNTLFLKKLYKKARGLAGKIKRKLIGNG